MRVLIAGGGTGGHIYPALSIAKAIQELSPKSVVEFVGTPNGLESKLVPQTGYKLHTISVGRLKAGFIERILTLFSLPIAILKGIFLVIRFSPDAVIGVGGYASGPVVLAAALLCRRTYVWEPNAYPGLANRYLSRFVSRCLVVFEEAAPFMKNKNVTRVHMPIRNEIEQLKMRVPRTANFRVLVFGGSQGARAINNALSAAVQKGGAWLNSTEIVHQTGPQDFERMKDIYKGISGLGGRVQVLEYLNDMPDRYAWADMVIARSGTGTISELAACGKAALLIPLPTAADDHQTKNAEALVKIGGAELLKQNELTPERLIREIERFREHPEIIEQLERKVRQFHKANAAKEIAQILLKDNLRESKEKK